MANEIRYQVGFDVKQGDLSKLKSSLQQLQKLKFSDIMKINDTDLASARNMFHNIQVEAKNVEEALKNAFNTKLNTTNIAEFNNSLRQSGSNIKQVYQAWSKAGTVGENAFRNLSSQVLSTNIQLKETHTLLDKMATTLTNTIKWNIASGAVNGMSRAIEQAWGYTKSLDTSLNNIRIVTGKSAEEMGNFAIKANEAAQSLGKTTTDYTNAALIYAQQGLSDKEIEERTRLTLMTASVTGQSASDVSQELTAVWNGYKVNAEEAELYIDRLAAVAATTASDLEELSTGMSKVASAAAAMGVGEDQLAAQLSTIISVTRQAPESVGTALRTVYARISDIKAGIDEDGVTLGNYSGKMAELGFNVLDAAGNLRDMGEVMEEIGGRWQDLTREQQISLAQTMAGQRQYSNLIALFDNFEKYNQALNTAQNAAGTLQEQQDIYMESTTAHLQTLKAAVENIYDSLADTDSINSIVDGLAVAANLTANLVDSLGGGVAVLRSLGAIGLTVFSEQIARGINTTITNLEIGRDNAIQFDQALEATKDWQGIPGLDDTSKKLLENREQLLELARLMTPEQFTGMQTLLNDITALGNEIASLEEKKKPLADLLNKDFMVTTPLEDFLGSDQADQVQAIIKEQTEGFQEISEQAEKVGQVVEKSFNKFTVAGQKGSKTTKELKKAFNDAAGDIQVFMDNLVDMQEKGYFLGGMPEIEAEIDNLGNEWQKVLQKINAKKFEPEATEQAFKGFLQRLVNFTNTAGDKIDKRYKDLLQVMGDPDFINKLRQQQQVLEQQIDKFVIGQERMQRAAKIENWAKAAGGIAQIGSAIQQVQNLGSIWANSDLSTGQKLLQTITNLSISLPMLASGFTKATVALGLMQKMTTAQAVTAGISTKAQAAHAFSIGLVGTASEGAAVKVQLLNTTLLLNPFVAVATAVIGLATAFGILTNAADEANASQQEYYQTEIEKENKVQEEIETNKKLYNSLDELDQKYKNGQITRSELKSTIDDLIRQYSLEGKAADELAKSYGNLAEYIRAARLQAAKEAQRSAKRELDNTKQNVFTTAKKTSGKQIFGDYYLNVGSGLVPSNDPDILKDALKRVGGDAKGGGMAFRQSYDFKSILDLYEDLNNVINNIQPLLSDEQKQASKMYQNTIKWLNQMQPKIQAYKNALKDVAKYEKDRVALEAETSDKINFQKIQSLNEYIQQRKILIDEYQKLLTDNGDTKSDPAALADAYISEYYNSLYKQFDEVANYIDKIRNDFGGSNSIIESLLGQLDEKHFTVLMDLVALHPSVIHDWQTLGKAIHYISEQDFSNINNLPQIQGNAADQYNIYQSLEDQVSGGKTINAKELERLTPEVQEFFSMMANGSYKMTGNAKEFYETVNSLKLDGFKTALAQINSQIDKTENLQNQNFNYKELDKQAYKGAPFADYGAVDYDLAQKQLDYLQVVSSGNAEMQVAIQLWQEQIDKQNLSKEAITEIAEAIANAGNQTSNLDEKTKELKQNAEELAHQLHDAMFPTDSDVNTEALESLSETIQDIATESEELADSLQTNARVSEDVAESILRFDDAIEDVVKNYDNWMDALKNGSIQEQAEIIDDLRDAYADLLDLDGSALSNDFLTNAENLDLMKAAIDGDIDAYNQLLELSGQNIAMSVGLDSSQFFTDRDTVWNAAAELAGTDFGDIEIGAQLNDEGFLNGLSNMVNQAGMTAQQATDYLSSMGVDAEVVEQKSQGTETKTQTGWESTLVPNTQIGEVPVVSGIGGETTITPMPITFTTYSSQYTPTTEEVTDTKENSAFSLKVTSAHKSSGGKFKFTQAKNGGGSKGTARRSGGGGKKGGGGGGGKGAKPNTSQKETKEPLKNQVDLYHDINIQIGDLNRKLDNTQKKQDRLYGKDLINNLNEQNEILDQQIGKLEQKYQLQKKDQSQKQEELKELGVVFDGYGKIGNYMDILETKQVAINELIKQYNLLIQQYNEITDDERKKELNQQISELDKKIQHEKQKMDALQKGMDEYDKLMDDMQENEDQREAKRQEQFQNNIRKFRTEIEIRLDMGEAEKDWNNFKRNVLNHSNILKDSEFDKMLKDVEQNYQDILSYFDINGQMGTLQALTDQINATQDELDEINGGGESSIYGDNKKQAMQDLKTDLNELMQQMEDIESLIDNIDQAYLNTIDDIMNQFDKQIEDYELIGQLIEHDVDLLSLLYGDKNYDAMDKYYTTLQNNNLKQLDSLRQQRDFWKQQWDEAVAREDTEAAKKFEENYKETIGNLNSLIEESAQNLKDKYINAIDDIFNTLDKKLSGGIGTDYLSLEWDLMNKNAEEYLDTINSAFAVQELEDKFRKALNDTKSLKAQQALKNLMDQQLNNLRAKEKLTEYDVERAEKLLQIEQARIALEDAQASKTSMRLKRDSQGNYSYEYVADQGDITDAQQNLANAQNDLYNFDKDRYQSNLGDMLSAWKDFQEEYKEIITDVSLTEEERVAKTALLREQYGQYINDKTAENMVIRTNLMESAFMDIAAIYQTDVGNYQQMADDQKNILMSDLVPAWQSGIQQMADKVAGQGGFIPVCEEAFEDITEATEDYKDELDEMARVAGVDLNDVKQGVDDLSLSFADLVEKNDDLLDRMDKEMTAISDLKDAAHDLKEEYDSVYEAAKRAVSMAHDSLQDTRRGYDEDDEDWDDDYLDDGDVINDIGPGAGLQTAPKGWYTDDMTPEQKAPTTTKLSSTEGSWGYSQDPDGSYSIYRVDADTMQKVASNQSASAVEDAMTILKYDYKNRYGHYDTGGYTGNWSGNQGMPAILHKKELVLNATDTQNMLNSIEILRGITSGLNGNLFNKLSNISSYNQLGNTLSSDAVEQSVHIDASFPNVDSKREIEEALSDLVNLAAQRALRNR